MSLPAGLLANRRALEWIAKHGGTLARCACCGRPIGYKRDRAVRLFASTWCGNCVSAWLKGESPRVAVFDRIEAPHVP